MVQFKIEKKKILTMADEIFDNYSIFFIMTILFGFAFHLFKGNYLALIFPLMQTLLLIQYLYDKNVKFWLNWLILIEVIFLSLNAV
jgi:hypothetical protein